MNRRLVTCILTLFFGLLAFSTAFGQSSQCYTWNSVSQSWVWNSTCGQGPTSYLPPGSPTTPNLLWTTTGGWAASGPISAKSFSTFDAAVASAGVLTSELVMDKTLGMMNDVTIPATLTITYKQGHPIALNNHTLTLAVSPNAGPYQIFSGAGTIVGLTNPDPRWFGAKGDGTTDDKTPIDAAVTAAPNNSVIDLTDPTSYYSYNSSAIIESSGIGYGLTKKINVAGSPSFWTGDNGAAARGIARKYTYIPGDTKRQAAYQMAFEITANSPTISSSMYGLNVLGLHHGSTSPTYNAYHNLQSFVESDAPYPSEPTGFYTSCQATAGATCWGSIVSSISTPDAATIAADVHPNHLYGQQIVVGWSDQAPLVSSKAQSIWATAGKITYGNIIWGVGGYDYGSLVTNMSDRNEVEIAHGGDITSAYGVVGSPSLVAAFTLGQEAITAGMALIGSSSAKTCIVSHVTLTSGTWAGHDAAGLIYCSSVNGAFTPGENLIDNATGHTMAVLTADYATVGTITNGLYLKNTTYGIKFDGLAQTSEILATKALRIRFSATGVDNYLSVLDSTGTPVFYVYSDGTIGMPSLPTSSAGLSAGQLYNDSGTIKVVLP